MPKALSGEKAENEEPPIENVDYHRDYGKVKCVVELVLCRVEIRVLLPYHTNLVLLECPYSGEH